MTWSAATEPEFWTLTKRFFPQVHDPSITFIEKAVQALAFILTKHWEAHSIPDPALNVSQEIRRG